MKKTDTQTVLEKMNRLSKRYGFYLKGEKTLVGFSGGADSVTLLHALLSVLGKDRVAAVHINHMLRGDEADADEAFCRDFCQKREIPFLSQKIDVLSLCGGSSFEETARNVRYRVFEEAARELNCTTVSLAHTASDHLETLLFHLCRGAGASGLTGIPVQRPLGKFTVVRPLLDVTRDEILAYIEENDLSYRTDKTNADTAYTRNFIRAEIVPLLQKINPAVQENARYASDSVAELQAYAEKSANEFLEAHAKNDVVSVHALSSLSPAVLYPVLDGLYKRAGGETLSRTQALAMEEMISKRKKGASVSLSGNLTARLDGESLRFFHNAVENVFPHCETSLAWGKNQIGENKFIYIGESPQGEFSFCAKALLCEASLPSLFVRKRQNGEAYRFGGMTRKLKKLLCGCSLAEKNRPVICDGDGIIWLPGFPVADGKGGEIPVYYVEK
ncbi:MAG: tRNA lysidine(34) synthetase TilS [Clostridia bacterium]|nr:tRNA lysidine(34) synthetase TilS [Clostridia bacterium]